MLIEETIGYLRARLGVRLHELSIAGLRIGIHLTAVVLSDGSAGVCSTTLPQPGPKPREGRDYGRFSPLNIRGIGLDELLETSGGSRLKAPLRLAVINALSAGLLEHTGHKVLENTDPISLLDLSRPRHIAMVGAFHSYIPVLLSAGQHLSVVELDKSALAPEYASLYVPAGQESAVISKADAVIFTGMTLANHSLDRLLTLTKAGQELLVAGPSAGVVPDVLFSRGVHMIGATRITDPGRLLDLVAEGGSGYHLFRYCAQKITILPPDGFP